nr:MAG TPA: hypothetical protein [Caudoviricetes sp.]
MLHLDCSMQQRVGAHGKVGLVNKLEWKMMTYKKLSANRKKALSKNANEYAKTNYKQVLLRLKPEVAEEFERVCQGENLSRVEMLKKLLEIYHQNI